MEAADAGNIQLGFCLGGNLYGSNPDLKYAEQALSKSNMLVYLSTTLNTGHAWGLADQTIILPVLARDEEPQPTTQESMFSYVRLSDGGKVRHVGPRSEVTVISHLAKRVLGESGPIDWLGMENTGRVREAIAQVVPGFEAIKDIDSTRSEFQIGGRTFHEPKFATPNGKAMLHCHELPLLKGEGNELRLMTVRSEGQFNTVVYEEHDFYRGQDRRDVILVHPDDVARLGLQEDQRVTVKSSTGELKDILVRPYPEIRSGNALMYYPEANVLISRRIDPQSRTPAFKCELITLS
jgi:anaerobic selenocysteine-containing dehydrogenase